jgi:hypothetical protein
VSNGKVTTVAGKGPIGSDNGSFSGDGGPATEDNLFFPDGVAMSPTGDLYIRGGA